MDATNRSKGKRKGESNGVEIITGQDISWFEESCDKTPVAFYDKFGILKCEDGHRRYARALRQSEICEQERTLLTNDFEASESLIYWEHRNTKAVVKKSAWKTAGNMIRGSEPFVETIIAENAKEQRQHSAVENLTSSGQSFGTLQEPVDIAVQQSEVDESCIRMRRTNEHFDKDQGKNRFRVLQSSDRAVERALFEASVKGGIPIRSNTIDLSRKTTKRLFLEAEWSEIKAKVSFDLSKLPQSTLQFMNRLRLCMLQGRHPYNVPPPNDGTMSEADRYNCRLALKTAAECMVDGEKTGIDSSRRKNMSHEYNSEEP
ncbi:hypothetical protein BGZ93_005338 [Podila epicladia]|nr:hypothetical protein BGZ92_001661 [Podila epicladia]KAG0100770.1 hypothetical protein BGZ93_005338 [Podila epicladia]